MFKIMRISKPLGFDCFGVLSPKRLLHLTPALQADTLEEVRRRPRDVEPLPPDPKLKMDPFVKSLCLGKVDANVLAFPEFDLGRLTILENMASEMQKLLNGLHSPSSDEITLTKEVLSKLKGSGIFGVNISSQFKGKELTCMEINRLGEVLASDYSLFQTLNVHISYISEIFSRYASEEQKQRYLPLLASGELLCGLAIWEEKAGVDVNQIECYAIKVDDSVNLSGSKIWVNNLSFVDKLVVFAKYSSEGNSDSSVSCFLVDKHSPGITTKKIDTLGVNNFDLWEVNFDRTPVPIGNLIGEEGNGIRMIMEIINGKFTINGAANASVLRRLLDMTVHHVTFKEALGQPLQNLELVQQRLSEVAALIYTLESISYLTANFLDDYEDPDCEVEVAIVNLFASEALTKGFQICMSLLGSHTYRKDDQCSKMYHDALFATNVQHSSDFLRMFISALCIQYYAYGEARNLSMERNPLMFPKEAMKRFWKLMDQKEEIPMIDKIVSYHLHPVFEESSHQLELCISYLNFVIRDAAIRWGTSIIEKQVDMARIADIAVDCFCISAVLARASRSMCIGLPNSEDEFRLAEKLTYSATQRVLENSKLLINSPHVNNDVNYRKISSALVMEKGYKYSHPLSRNN